ncbi:MAG: bifunctional phosphoribosylaminoimidazolecarboxamide formyltransferase/IMP cyclohydrolase [Alphaproteobacteria bacterium]|jgi:phosphoribosylaminoimidazolecarboxamide formyltransferase/IMP cyclohydrolase|nr:bifunctional phosphoribosylaminoimidazolecarboxamide formyltransferase/IMP cyclohydrolase [Alphaproteobacteria bacterium]MDP6566901.1 bifunctional phosphoribosylaminoimidazolecarboxamide formyltransferase/IMP cyclohydrolase [Alphaproteobacteria bacterium]MDP6815399.1 bifunctional phosphoribosylaminoimidazolecarboxamide formyltransferase/IMP cyclohydrolase [Alphaproteobacteria bacterium]
MPTAPTIDLVPIKRALISVSDKDGLLDLGAALAGHGVEILSTGGTARALAEAGIAVKEVSEHTGFPEMMDGRVKTLHPKVHGGILALRDDPGHAQSMRDHEIGGIDLIVVNLYPFEATVASGADFATCIENIDIGGPAMIRSAAKNHAYVAVLTDPADYPSLIAALAEHGGATDGALRRRLAARAYARTGSYDGAIATWFAEQLAEPFPDRLVFAGAKQSELRYGENPHQAAAFYLSGQPRPGVATARQLQGKELSYNNLNDTDAAFELVAEFDPRESAAVAIIKHANPCGVATGGSLVEAHAKALRCDPVSAFGGIVAANRPLDAAAAAAMVEIFTEVIIAPDADEAAIAAIAAKKNLRLLLTGGLPDPAAGGMTMKSLAGGYLLQSRDAGRIGAGDVQVVSKRPPSERELADLLFAFRVCKHVKSNAIIYVKDGATVGIGAGQMSRVDSARIAARKSADAAREAGLEDPLTIGSVVASDAFFPFADGLLAAAEAGATAVIQPGGSMRDQEVIDAADEAGLAMVLTGMRHFRH